MQNPFDQKILIEENNLSTLKNERNQIKGTIEWYEANDINDLTAILIETKRQLTLRIEEINNLHTEKEKLEKIIQEHSIFIGSLWNPRNWLDSDQITCRKHLEKLNTQMANIDKKLIFLKDILQNLRHKYSIRENEYMKYKNFNYDSANKQRIELSREIESKTKLITKYRKNKMELDHRLAPIFSQINLLEKAINDNQEAILHAEKFEHELSACENSYQRRAVHIKCEAKFGVGSPSKIIDEKKRNINKINRDLKKLNERINTEARRASFDIKSIVIDGNNMCYQGNVFIGLGALRAFIAKTSNDYQVTLIFDAGIRGILRSSNDEIKNMLGGNITVHIVATKQKADETILDFAGNEIDTYVISNDRYIDYGDKAVVKEGRIIRHEIISGILIIHDLDIKIKFT
jgi:hypothetical protein